MCKEYKECKVPANGDKMHYDSFDELTDDLKNKFKCEATRLCSYNKSKKVYVDFINKLNENGDKLISDYVNVKTKVRIHYGKCGHTHPEGKGVMPSNYKRGDGCGICSVKDETGNKYGRLTVIKEYGRDKNGSVLWLCKCECGNEVVVRCDSLINGNTKSCGCLKRERASDRMREQIGENNLNWKGGISPISTYLRNLPVVRQWHDDTYVRENNRCQLTGKHVHGGNSDVHHLYGFNLIVLDAHELHSIQVKPQVKDYTEEELHKLEEYVVDWHKDTSNAVLLCNEVHNLFHNCKDKDGNVLYGKGSNTPEQFEEFRERYLNGEFKDLLGDVLTVTNKL